MDATEIKAAIDHGFSDMEAIATKLNHPGAVAEMEKIKALLESPLALEGLALGISFGIAKLAGVSAAVEPAKAPTGAPSA